MADIRHKALKLLNNMSVDVCILGKISMIQDGAEIDIFLRSQTLMNPEVYIVRV